jgi:hypothetical protein
LNIDEWDTGPSSRPASSLSAGAAPGFIMGFREAFPDLNFWSAADLITEGDYVVGRWEGGGTYTGAAFSDFLAGSLPTASGRMMPVYRNDCAPCRERQNCRRNRPGR